jgi:uncharacterized protein YbcC (UPF0753/DUF2309 family)
VFEGNGGDLRIGLSRQSLNDGERWVHEPLRLTVIIDAPREAIERVIAQHEVVRQLLENNWLHLWRYDEDSLVRYLTCANCTRAHCWTLLKSQDALCSWLAVDIRRSMIT